MIQRIFSATVAVLFGIISLYFTNTVYALSEGPSQPEAMQFEPVDATDVVNLATGDFSYSLPLLVVPGSAGDFPLGMSYHAKIGPNQEATWVGLGWTLNPGAINRTVNGYPDDYREDLVKSHNEMEGLSGYNIGVGISYSNGYGSVGLNMSYDSFNSNYGVNFVGKVGFVFEVGPFDAFAGASVSVETSGGDIQGAGAGVGLSYGYLSVAGGITANSSGVSPYLSGGINTPLNTSVGFSLSSQGGFTTNFQVVGFGSSSMTTVGAGRSWSYSKEYTLPIYWFTINLAASEWGWFLDETYFDVSYGYLYQSSYIANTDPLDSVYETTLHEKKYERMENNNFLYPSQDVYIAEAQGINGVFKPFMKKMFHLEDDLTRWEYWVLGKAQIKSIPGLGVNSRQDAVFRFLGDGGANFIATSLSDPAGGAYSFENILPDRFGSRRIEPEYDPVNYKIIGFRIIDSDGTQYEFMQPVMEWLEHTWSNQRTWERSGNRYVENTLKSNRTLGTPYASNWLLTAIKGPDYVDRDGNGKANDGDWGYWVTFAYRKASRPQIWRSPYQGMGPGATSKDIETASIGLRDMVLLERIETASHLAVFKKSERKDRKTPSNTEEVALPGKLENKIGDDQQRRVTYIYRFPGDWRKEYQNVPDDKEFLVLTYAIRYDEWEVIGFDRKLRLSKSLSATTTAARAAAPPGTNVSAYDWTIDYDGYDTIFTINIYDALFRYGIYEADLMIQHFFQDSYSDAQKLDRIDLYSKADPHVSYSHLDGSWSIHPSATSLKSVKFDYDYSLCPNTPNSLATQGDGAPGGKLTLKSVEFLGKNNSSGGIPPYRFVYANGAPSGTGLNPAYHEHDWDNWGSYRSPANGRGKYIHKTPQEKSLANLAAAWSLTEIITPTGGSIHIAYESDDYYHVGDHIDFVKFNHTTDSGSSLERKAYQVRKHGTEDNTVVLGNATNFHPNNYTNVRSGFADEVGLVPGRYIAIIETTPSNNNYGWPTKVTVRQIAQVNVHERTIASAGRLVKQFGGYVIKFSGDPFPFDVNDNTEKYFLKLYPRKNYGSGIRVKSITTTDGIQSFKTVYNYQTADGFSTGVAASLPSLYEDAKYLFRELDNAEKWENTGFYIHENPNLPAPNVIYSQVEVLNVGGNGNMLNGKTVFEFMTARDFPYSATNLSFRTVGGRDDDRSGVEIARLIDDKSGIHGLPKATTFYEMVSNQSLRKVRKQEALYAFSNGLHQHAKVFKENDVSVDSPRSPLGLIYERHRFENDWKLESHPHREKRIYFTNGDITKLYQNVYVIGNRMTTYDYDSPTSVGVAGTLTANSRNFIWDALGGHVIGSAQDQSDRRALITKLVPAYWKYLAMKNKNMLTQLAQETTYISDVASFSEDGAFKQYTFSPDGILASNVTTWFNWGNDAWRKNDTYIYNKKIDWADGGYSPFNDWNYASAVYPTVSASKPWHMASNITKYNEYSHPVEESHIDKTYSSAIYGYKRALPIAIAKNASLNEIYYLDFETQEGLNTLGTVSAYFTGDGEGRTGKAFKAFASAGPWYNLDGLKKQKVYLVSFWAKKGTADLSHRIRFYFSGPGMAGVGVPIFKSLQSEDRWEYLEFKFIPLDNGTVEMHLDLVNVPGTGGLWHYVDDLRIHPLDATMSTFAYDPLTLQVTSITDENNISAYFEYDDYGRLVRVRDQDKNLLSKYVYHYGQQILGNYIKRQSILTPITSESDISRLADDELIQTIDYYSGLAKAAQSIAIKGSPSKKDIVTPIEYNELGFQIKSYSPYAANSDTGEYRPGDLNEQKAFYQSAPGVPHTEYPLAETVHEKSPLLRVREQGYAGEPWQPAGRTPSSGHTLKTKYRTNDANEVRLWKWNQVASRFQADGFYATGQLIVTEIEDENGNPVIDYKDKADRVVLKRVLNRNKNNHLIRLDTYYVYDDFGNLRFIVPPRAVFGMLNSNAWFIDRVRDSKWVTEYIYDGYHRVVEKKVPGAESVYTIYDRLGRVVLTQDGKLRQLNRWLFTKYDMLGRPVMTGIYHDVIRTSRTAMQSFVDNYVDNINTFFYEKRIEVGGSSFSMDVLLSNQGYSNQAFPPLGPASQLLTVTYYDDYDFNNNGRSNDDYSYVPDAEFPNNKAFYRLKNKVTGRRVRVLKDLSTASNLPNWITDVFFYDKYGRVIQVYTRDHKGITIVNTEYDFPGKVLKTKRVHTSTDGVIVKKRYEYDHAGRVSKVYQQNNNDPEILLKENRYNELGVLIEKNLHSENNGNTFLQSVDFKYNIRGWLTHLNDIASMGGSQSGDPGKDLFAMRLRYDEVDSTRLENIAQYNGNISAIDWGVPPPVVTLAGGIAPAPNPDIHSYTFKYDKINQLIEAKYRHRTFGNLPLDGDEQYNVFAAYDPNGNIESIKRNGVTGGTWLRGFFYGLVDDLTYYYHGNQLTGVDDRVPGNHGYDFYEKNRISVNTGQAEYIYDKNGNMIEDKNKAINVSYNHLNLPTLVDFGGGNKIEWLYSAAGEKLRKTVYNGGSIAKTIDYVGGIVYEGDTIDFFATDEGRVKKLEDGLLRYEYNLTDHLGNVRVSFTKGANGTTPEVLQEDHYYPFGIKLKGLSKVESSQKENKFTYNGKELEDEHGLNWYHYGARYYDPQLGRWHTMDPANQYYSPYLYVGNNPVLFLDPDGQEPGSPFDDPERIFRDLVEKGYIPPETGEAYIEGHRQGMNLAAVFGTAITVGYGAILYGPELFYAVSAWLLSNPQRAQNVAETAIDIVADSYRPDPGDVLEVAGKKGLKASVEISESLAESGFTGQELNWFLGKPQRKLIGEFFGRGLEGALKRSKNFEVPSGLTRETLEAYRAAALKIMREQPNNQKVQAVQGARIELIDRALKELELP